MNQASTDRVDCYLKGEYASCWGPLDYEHEGNRCCVLHFPSEDKKDAFRTALEAKLKHEDFNFGGAIFPNGTASFSGVSFSGEMDFREATFYDSADFRGATFGDAADFREVAFSDTAYFLGATFSGGADFGGAGFSGGADFGGANFRGEASFGGVTFIGRACFRGTTFIDSVTFGGAAFKAEALFDEAHFEGEARFRGAALGVTFSLGALFSKAKFSGGADFGGVTFIETAYFAGATFSGGAHFGMVTFGGFADFGKATFGDLADFERAAFRGSAYFSGATFKESARFHALKAFPSTALVFRGATIEKPERVSFHTTHLRPSWFVDVDAQKFDFSDVEWFRIPDASEPDADKLERLLLEEEIENLVGHLRGEIGPIPPGEDVQSLRKQALRKLTKSCRRLMNNAEENRDYPTANEFHYWSMEAQRKDSWSYFKNLNLRDLVRRETWREIPKRFGIITTLYWILSGYGERPRRAFWILVVMWFAFAALYFVCVASSPFWVFAAADVWQGIDYLGQALVYSMSALTRLNPRPQSEELDWFQTLVTVEGILGPLQIALFLLAVRRKVMR